MIANVVWPALYLLQRLLSVLVILPSLLIEFLFMWKLLGLKPGRAIQADLAMNLVSSVAGILLIALLGLAVVLPFKETFGTAAWLATFAVGVMVNACLESLVVNKWFKPDFGTREFWLLVAANTLTVGLAYGSFILFPIKD